MYDNRYESHMTTDMTQELTFGCVWFDLWAHVLGMAIVLFFKP